MQEIMPILNPNEAPAGFYAIPKEYNGYNICRDCDWRAECNDPATDLMRHDHRCMGFPIQAKDGRTIQRNDGVSVVFKRRPQPTTNDETRG